MAETDAKMETAGAEDASTSKKASDLDSTAIRAQIDGAKKQIESGDTTGGLDAFLSVEKQCRLAEDMSLSQETCRELVTALHAAGKWEQLLEHITILTKRRGQLKSTVQAIVRQATEILDTVEGRDKQVELIKVLQAVTEGKLVVEIDRARLTRRLAAIHESDGRVGDAADAMQEVAVETFGAMHRSEKVAYVLEQMRLCMDAKDFTRAQILSRKVSPRAFAAGQKEQEAGEISLQGTAIEKPAPGTPSMAELKVRYYQQMIRFHKESNNYIEVARCLLAMYADAQAGGTEEWAPLLKQAVWYIALCPAYSTAEGAGSDYETLRATVAADPRLQDVPHHSDLLQVFITDEIAGVAALEESYAGEMAQQSSIFGGDAGDARRADFRRRVREHNVLVVARYYSRLRLPRLATLLAVSEAEAEEQLSDLVVKGAVVAKIDRPAGLVRFQLAHDSAQVLDGWGANISKILGLVETACQKIQKESMQHGVPIGTSA